MPKRVTTEDVVTVEDHRVLVAEEEVVLASLVVLFLSVAIAVERVTLD